MTGSTGRRNQFTLAIGKPLKAALFRRALLEDRSAGSIARRALRLYLDQQPADDGGGTS